MAQGFCPALLRNINDVAEGNAPGRKLAIAGFLSALFCCQNSSVNPVNDQFDGASYRPLTVSYRKRPLVSEVSTTDDCNVDRVPQDLEWTLPGLSIAKHSFYISDDQLQQYCTDAIATQSVGKPPTPTMRRIYDLMLESANIILRKINQTLELQMATRFGVNVTTGQSNGKVINVDQDGAKYVLDNGIIDMLRDIQENEICGEPCLVGNGLWAAWDRAQAISCCNSAGMDMSKVGLPRFFFDKDSVSAWGPNTAALLAPGSVKFISRNAYVGPFAGIRGSDWFGTFPMPVDEFGCNLDACLRDLIFDVQIRTITCSTTVVGPGGGNITVNRGTEVILSKRYALWVQPADAYAVGDPLYDTNGTLRYYLTNTPTDPKPYAYGY